MEFAVKINGQGEEGQAFWVITVDCERERFLTAKADGVFEWVSIADCTLVKIHTPDQPILVLPVQPAPANGVVVPGNFPNRAMRRNGDRSL